MKGKHSATKNAQLRDELSALREEVRELKASNRRLTNLHRKAVEEIIRAEEAGIPAVRELQAKLNQTQAAAENHIDALLEYHQGDMQRCKELIEQILREGHRHNIELLSHDQIEQMINMFEDVFDCLQIGISREERRNRRRNTAGPDAIRRAMNYARREL